MPELIENRMVIDSEWNKPQTTEKSGWYCSWEDKFIADDEALEYALDQLLETETPRKNLRTMRQITFLHTRKCGEGF